MVIQQIDKVLGLIISLSTVFGIFTGILNKMFNKKLKPLEDKIDKHEKNDLDDKMAQWRFEVVSFASQLRNGDSKTYYEYSAIFQFIDKYEKAVEELGINNGLFTEEVVYIKKKYEELDSK